jgi:hypothetical protein
MKRLNKKSPYEKSDQDRDYDLLRILSDFAESSLFHLSPFPIRQPDAISIVSAFLRACLITLDQAR